MGNAHYDSANREFKPAWLNCIKVIALSGESLTIPDSTQEFIVDPAATIAALTVKMPAKPLEQQSVTVLTTQDITAFTLNANTGHTIAGAPAGALFTANTSYKFIFSSNKWYKI